MMATHSEFADIAIREFIPGDAAGISALIRRNYGDTYHKDSFYDPGQIRDSNASRQIISVVAHYFETVVGHFAMFPSEYSNIAEIGAAVVDPAFKHLGIMNRMFDSVVSVAQKMEFSALYGEAIMLHPFSQKANLHHGMSESAILLGEVPSSIEIEHRYKNAKRSGGLESFLLFDRNPRSLRLPSRYARMIADTYHQAGIPVVPSSSPSFPRKPGEIRQRYNPVLNIGYLIIDACPTPGELDAAVEAQRQSWCDMIYVDINLHRVQEIDALTELLNERNFFYGGVMFMFYGNEDYLRLQRKNTVLIDEEHLVCHSEFARKLFDYILEDERRVLEGR